MGRVKWKGFFIKKWLLSKLKVYTSKNKFPIKTKTRTNVILPMFVDSYFFIYNGTQYTKKKILVEMVGYKFGEFSETRKEHTFKKRKRKKMGQKVNPNSFRVNTKIKTSNLNYFAKNSEESSIFVFKNLELNKFLIAFFQLFGIIIHSLRIQWARGGLFIATSYFILYKNKASFRKILKHHTSYKKYFSFGKILLESLSLFVQNSLTVVVTLSNLNVFLKLNYIKSQLKTLKFFQMSLRKFSKLTYYNQTINIMLILIRLMNSARLLTAYLVILLKTLKKQSFFFFFLRQVLDFLLKSKIARIYGIKLKINGKINFRPRASSFKLLIGSIPLQSVNIKIAYAQDVLFTRKGAFGINVWVFEKKNVFTTKAYKV